MVELFSYCRRCASITLASLSKHYVEFPESSNLCAICYLTDPVVPFIVGALCTCCKIQPTDLKLEDDRSFYSVSPKNFNFTLFANVLQGLESLSFYGTHQQYSDDHRTVHFYAW